MSEKNLYDQLLADNWKNNTIKIYLINPANNNKIVGADGKAGFIECKSSEADEWKKSLQNTANRMRKAGQDDSDIDRDRMSNCRALAAVTTSCHIHDVVSFSDHGAPELNREQIESKLVGFYFNAYSAFTHAAIAEVSKDSLFMQMQDKPL